MKITLNFIVLLMFAGIMQAQVSAKLIQTPDVSETHICFTFGDDLWIVAKAGGNATRLSSPVGRETNPKFSPDGTTVAFQANYDGSNDIYTIPKLGGIPNRVTGHGWAETILDWTSDGSQILFSTSSESGKQRWSQFYLVEKDGGLPEKLPVELGAYANLSDDKKQLAFTDKSRAFRTWKRYRGGTAPDIHIMNMETLASENITKNDANDEMPMWHGSIIYYLSDKGEALRNNIWKYDTQTKAHTQITFFKDFDIHFPSKGPSDIVFEAGGEIHLLNLSTEQHATVQINAIGDFARLKPVTKSVGKNVEHFYISPDGKRALVEARGDVFTLPKKKGFVKNITRTSGVAERFPAWSPNGKSIAYFSDKSGEYELTVRDLKSGEEKKITNLGPGYRYNIFWSPDSKKVAFVDQTMTFNIVDIQTGELDKFDKDNTLYQGGLEGFNVSWSSDSQWVAYVKNKEGINTAIYVYNCKTKKIQQVTSGFYSDNQVEFGPDGKYLYLTTNRKISPSYSDYDNTWVYPNATQVGVITLRKDVEHPMALENDEVEMKEEEKAKDDDDDDDDDDDKKKKKKKSKKKKGNDDEKDDDDKEDKDDDKEDKDVKIDFDGIERRLIILPIEGGNLGGIAAVSGKLLYIKSPNTGADGGESQLKFYDFKEKEEKTIMSGVWAYELSHDGSSVAVMTSNGTGIIDVAADQKMEDKLALNEMVSTIDPKAEWKQIFNDVWRLERDFFYDENMHGVDWDGVKTKYAPLIDQAMSRYDVNFILGEVIGELNASHTYRGGGDSETASFKNVGYLGVDWAKENGEFKIKRIVKGADWDNEVRSPLDIPGIDISEGDYVLAINGIPMNTYKDPWIAFAGMANKTVELTVNKTANKKDAKKVLIKPLRSESRLRNLEWIENNRKMVDKLSDGKIGYVYVPSTGIDGQNELIRMFYGQWQKEGLIVDERFNNGGQIPDRFVELLNRKPLAYFNVRDGKDWQWPPVAHFGPKAMLINGWSGSGGDAFPDYFRKAGLGPLIGSRTWGGLIGISGAPSLIDGGSVTVPSFRMYDPNGEWFKEGHGVDPDIEVLEDHEALAKGNDPQIERAVKEIMEALNKQGDLKPKPPQKEIR